LTAARGLGHARELTGLQRDDKAAIHAAMRVDELLEASDLDGYTVWKRVLKAVEELLDRGPPGKHDRVH
jgi:hypothetical protein